MARYRREIHLTALLSFLMVLLLFPTFVVAGELEDALDNPVQPDGTTPLLFSTDSTSHNAPWSAVTTTYLSGGSSAQSGTIDGSQYTRLETTVTGPASVSFYQKVSSQPTYDGLAFYIDTFTTPKSRITGSVNWQQKRFVILKDGNHTLRWEYKKNATVSKGSDAAWVDEVVVSPHTTVKVISPNGGEVIRAGSTINITWNAPAAAEKYDIFLSLDSGATWPAAWKIATGVTSTFMTGISYSWDVPVPNGNKTACKVKVVAKNNANVVVGSDVSDKPFTIEVLRVTSPNGGETLSARDNPNSITFSQYGLSTATTAALSYSIDGGLTWPAIGTMPLNRLEDQTYSAWIIPAMPALKNARVKVTLKNAAGTVVGTDTSNATFKITPVYTISGTVMQGGKPLADATIDLSGAEAKSTTTSNLGKYSFTNLLPGGYTVAASKTGSVFTPASRAIAITTANMTTANFTGTVNANPIYTISGTVSGATTTTVVLTLSGTKVGTAMTDGLGNYSFPNLPDGNYNVTPSKTGYTFDPVSSGVALTADTTGVDFTSSIGTTGITHSISGRITYGGTGLGGITVSVSGTANATVVTDTGGNYLVKGLKKGSYTVTPNRLGYAFTPTSAALTISTANLTANFTAVAIEITYEISGTVTVSGGGALSGVTVALTGTTAKMTTTDANGNYSFTGLANGPYTITPTLAGYAFIPSNIPVAVSGGDSKGNDFTGALITRTLTIVTNGTGSGVVTTSPAGIDCGSTCSAAYPMGTQIMLNAAASPGSVFDGFGGGCASIVSSCTLTLTADTTVTTNLNMASEAQTGNQLGLAGGAVAVHQEESNPPTSMLDLSTFTIEAWIFPLANQDMIIVADSAYYLMVKAQTDMQPLSVQFAVMTSTGFPAFLSYSGTSNPLTLNQWNHVVGMVDNDMRRIQIAVNGELSNTLTMGGGVNASFPQTFSIGNSYPQDLGDYPFIGRIDEVRVSPLIRYSGNFAPPPLLNTDIYTVGLWHFDETEGAESFADASGNGFTLTGLNGAATIAGTRPAPSGASGWLDPGFGSGGVVTSNPSFYIEAPHAALIVDNALYVVGEDQSVGPQWRIEKRNLTTGALDMDFGTGGIVTSNPSWGYDAATGAVSDGTYLYVVGYDMVPSFGDYEWRVEKRLLTTGALVTDFGDNGSVTVNPSTSADIPAAVVTDGSSLYIVGNDMSSGNSQWRIEKRYLNTGALVTDFGMNGVITADLTTSRDVVTAAVVCDSSLYVIGSVTTSPGYQWHVEKRNLNTGALVTDFGTNGIVESVSFYGEPYAAVNDGTDLYVVGYGGEGGGSPNQQWVIEKRNLSTGALAPAFGTGGVVWSDPSTGEDQAHSLALDNGSLYIIGYDQSMGAGNSQWRIEKRSMSTGSLVGEFGTEGVVTSNPSPRNDMAYGLVLDSTSLYVFGDDRGLGDNNSEWRIEKRVK